MSEYLNWALDYLSLLSDEISLAALFLSAAKYAVYAFIFSVILVIVCAKFKLFRRENKGWNTAAKLYFVFIPIVCMGAGATWGALQYPREITERTVEVLLYPVKQEAAGYLEGLPPEIRNNLSFVSVKSVVKEYLTMHFDGESTENNKGAGNWGNKLLRSWLITYLTNAILDKVNEKIASVTGFDADQINKLWQQNLIDIFKGDFLNDIVSYQFNKTIHSLQSAVKTLLLLLLLIPTADILIAKLLQRRKRLEQPT